MFQDALASSASTTVEEESILEIQLSTSPLLSQLTTELQIPVTADLRTLASQQCTPAFQQRTPASQQSIPASQQCTPASQQCTPASQQRTPASQQRTPASQQYTPASQQSIPASQQRTPASQQRTHTHHHRRPHASEDLKRVLESNNSLLRDSMHAAAECTASAVRDAAIMLSDTIKKSTEAIIQAIQAQHFIIATQNDCTEEPCG